MVWTFPALIVKRLGDNIYGLEANSLCSLVIKIPNPTTALRQLTFQQNRFLLRIGTTSRVWKFPTF